MAGLLKKIANVATSALKNAGTAAVTSATNAAVSTVANAVTSKTPSTPTITTPTVVNPSNTKQKNYVPWIIGGAVGLVLIIALASGGSSSRKK